MLILLFSFWPASFHCKVMKMIPGIIFMTLHISAGTQNTRMREIFFYYLENPVKHIWISNQKLSNSSELSNYNIYLAQRPYVRQAIIAIIAVLLRNMNINEYASNISTYRA